MLEQETEGHEAEIPVLWPGDLPATPRVSPHAILCKQAEWITQFSRRRVIGRVHSKSMGRSLSHTFSLTCPCFIDYAYFVARVRHPIDMMYPVQLFLCDNEGNLEECADEAEFLEALRKILQSQRLHDILGTLMAHVIPPESWQEPMEEIK